MQLCEYGCNKEGVHFLKCGKFCCEIHQNKCSAVKERNSRGGKRAYKNGKRTTTNNWKNKEYHKEVLKASQKSRIENIKSQPFEYWGKKLKWEFILIEQDNKCSICKISPIWNNKTLKFHLDHINGDNGNNKRENLRLICPNCHSQTETYCGKNINTGYFKVTDEEMIDALKSSKNIRQALIKVGLSAKGLNYNRAKKLSALLETKEVELRKVGEVLTGNADDNTEPSR